MGTPYPLNDLDVDGAVRNERDGIASDGKATEALEECWKTIDTCEF